MFIIIVCIAPPLQPKVYRKKDASVRIEVLCRLPKGPYYGARLILSYQSLLDHKWHIIAVTSAGDTNVGWQTFEYDFNNDKWAEI